MSRMFRALVRKEWRQLRGLRWVGLLLGLGLPAIMLTAAEGARQGLLPFGHLESYSMESLFLDAFPLGLLALWGLVGLLVGAQSFAADRMDGTETFLLERPISRRRIWEARWLASLGSLMSVVVAQFVFWCLLGWVTTGIEPSRWTLGPGLMAVLGVGIALTSIVGAGLAASMLRSPLQSVLLGVLLALVPPGLAALFTSLFPLARYDGIPVGAVLPWLLLASYVFGSFVMSCCGEPSGGGRFRRGAGVLLASTVVMVLLMPTTMAVAMRLDAGRLEYGTDLSPSPSRPTAALVSGSAGSGWVIDVATGEKHAFLAPVVLAAEWNAAGTRLAVARAAGRAMNPRLEIYDASGRELWSVDADEDTSYREQVRWAGDRLVVPYHRNWSEGGVLIVGPEGGEQVELPVGAPPAHWRLLVSGDSRTVFVLASPVERPDVLVLQELDVAAARIGEPAHELTNDLLDRVAQPQYAIYYFEISTSGRYLRRGDRLIDLDEGGEQLLSGCRYGHWLADDRLIWLKEDGKREALLVGHPSEEPRRLAEGDAKSIRYTPSPDRLSVLVEIWEGPMPPLSDAQDRHGRLVRAWVEDVRSGNSVDLLARPEIARRFDRDPHVLPDRLKWAGTGMIALTGPGFVSTIDLDPAKAPHDLLGRRPD